MMRRQRPRHYKMLVSSTAMADNNAISKATMLQIMTLQVLHLAAALQKLFF